MGKGPGRWDLRNPESLGEADESASAHKVPEIFREVLLLQQTLAEFGEGGVLDLADPLPGHVELLANLFQGPLLAVPQTEAELKDLQFARVEEVEAAGDRVAQVVLGVFLRGIHGLRIGQKVDQGSVLPFLPDGDVQRDGAGGNLAQFGDPFGFHLELVGELHIGGLAAEFVTEGGADAAETLDFVDEVDRETDRLALVGQGPADGLLDPPAGVGAELHPTAGLEAVHGLHQAEVALGDEVENRQAAVVVVGGDFHHEAEIRFDHQLAGRLVAAANATGEFDLLGAIEEGGLTDALEVGLKGGGEIFLPDGRSLLSGDFHLCFHTGLDRSPCRTFGLFLWGANFVKGKQHKKMHKTLIIRMIKSL